MSENMLDVNDEGYVTNMLILRENPITRLAYTSTFHS